MVLIVEGKEVSIKIREDAEFLDKITDLKLLKKHGITDRSTFYRAAARIVVLNPGLLLGKSKIEMPKFKHKFISILTKLDELLGMVRTLSQQIAFVFSSGPSSKNPADELLDKMLEDLLKIHNIRESKTLKDLEEHYPADFWKDFTNSVLTRLMDWELIRVLPGDRIQWL